MKLKKTIKSLVIFVLVFALFMSNWPPAWNNSGLPGEVPVVYADSVTYDRNDTWNVPDGVTEFTVELWGGGGAGGGTVTTNGAGGGGGAGGQYVSKTITVDSSSYSFTVGAGGSTTSGNGNAGGDTVFGSNLAVAKGGAGGASFSNGGAGGVGSTTGGIGDVVYRGGNGGNSSFG